MSDFTPSYTCIQVPNDVSRFLSDVKRHLPQSVIDPVFAGFRAMNNLRSELIRMGIRSSIDDHAFDNLYYNLHTLIPKKDRSPDISVVFTIIYITDFLQNQYTLAPICVYHKASF